MPYSKVQHKTLEFILIAMCSYKTRLRKASREKREGKVVPRSIRPMILYARSIYNDFGRYNSYY